MSGRDRERGNKPKRNRSDYSDSESKEDTRSGSEDPEKFWRVQQQQKWPAPVIADLPEGIICQLGRFETMKLTFVFPTAPT